MGRGAVHKILVIFLIASSATTLADGFLTVTPDPYDFGEAYLNTTKTVTLTLRNTSPDSKITAITPSLPVLEEPFQYLDGSFPGTGGSCNNNGELAPTDSCTVILRFLPTLEGKVKTKFGISYLENGVSKSYTPELSGTGIPHVAKLAIIEGASYDFLIRPLGFTAKKTFTLKSTGSLTVQGLKILTQVSAPFSFIWDTCTQGGDLAPGSTCTFVVSFAPNTLSLFASSLVLTANNTAESVSLSLSGAGQQNQTKAVLDTDYGGTGTGIAKVDPGGINDVLNDLLPLGDDTLISAGISYNGSSHDFALSKFKANGTLDTSFNGTGTVRISFGDRHDIIDTVLNASDGSVLMAGTSESDFAFAKVSATGSLETSFSGGGKKIVDLGEVAGIALEGENTTDFAYKSLLQPDGKSLTVGLSHWVSVYHLALLRLDTLGNPDPTFNGNGIVLAQVGNENTFGLSLAIQPDGKIIVVGGALLSANYDFLIARYTSSGILDPTFNQVGYQWVDFGDINNIATDVLIQNDGKIVIAGRSKKSAGEALTFALAATRLNADGTLDNSFGSSGKYESGFASGLSLMASIKQDPSGRYAIGWYRSQDGIPFYQKVTLLQANGMPDLSFGVEGTLTSSIQGMRGQRPAIAIQSDGKVLIGGSTLSGGQSDFGIERRW